MTVPRFLARIDEGARAATLSPEESHHAVRVLRRGVGSDVRVFDGRGREWTGRVSSARGSSVVVEITAEASPAAEAPVRVTLAVGVLKGSQMDAVVRDATMLGAAAIVPLETAHLAAGRRRSRGSTDHWRRVAIASATQCGRAVVPVVEDATTLAGAFDRGSGTLAIMLVEPSVGAEAATPLAEAAGLRPVDALVLVGPEGGWSAAEIALAVARGARLATLGPRTLRAETVPTVVLSALWTVWGW